MSGMGDYMERRWDRIRAEGGTIPWDYKQPGFKEGLNALFHELGKKEWRKHNAWLIERNQPELSFDTWRQKPPYYYMKLRDPTLA